VNIYKLARGLGWFSIGLGLSELLFPRFLGRKSGVGEYPRMTRAFGAREIAAGATVLLRGNPAPGMWSRVAGDAMDLGAIAFAMSKRRNKVPAALTLGAIAGVTALDIYTAVQTT
jgi:hypothetical protein